MADKKQLELQDDKPYYPIFYKSLKAKPKAIKEEHERKRCVISQCIHVFIH